MTDDQSSTAATDTVTFTVTAPLAALVAEAGTGQTVDSGARDVPLDGTGSTLTGGGRTVTYLWTRTGGTGDSSVAPSDPAALQTSFTAETLNPGDADVTHIFTLRVTDDQSSTAATDTVTFTVTAPLAALVAEAGTGQTVDSGARDVPLDGTGSTLTGGGRTVTYLWTRTGGTGDSSVAPSDPAALQTSFTAETLNPGDADVTHIFTLRVTDDQSSTAATDTVTFTVTAPLAALVAEAGTGQTVDSGARDVPLDGTGSTLTGGGRTVTYLWTRTGGTGDSSVAPSDPAALQTSFTAETLNPGDADVTHIFTLRVTDDQSSTAATDTVTFTVTAPLAALVAEAGTGQTVDSGARDVPLDGTGSTLTGGGRTVTYLWTRTGGTGDSSVAPSDPAALQTSFTAETLNPGDADVTHIFTLRVTDDQSSTAATDTVTFTVTAPLAALVAEAGTGQTVDSGARDVPLDGTGSTLTGGGRTVTYLWTRTGGTGDSSVAPSDPAALQTSFTAETLNPGDADVTHIFTLRVTDDQSSTDATDTVTFTVTAPLAALVAEAGTGQTVDSGARDVPLDGTGSTLTGGGRTVTYLWTRTGGTGDSSVAPSDPAALQTSFTAETLNPGDADVTHIFTLRVTDDQSSTDATDTVTFTVTAPLAALVAEAGTGQTVDSGARDVPLDGTGSTLTGGGRTVTYLWTRTGGTGDSSVAPSDPAALQTSFTAETLNPGDADVTHIFTLRVTDDQSSTAATDTVTFTVTAPLAALVAEAGTGQTVDSGARDVPLDGTGSTLTGGGRTVTYLWTRTGGTGDSSVAPSERRGDRECHCVGRSGGTLIIRHPQREDMGHVCIAGVQRLRRETRLERSRVARCHGTVAGPAGPGPEIGHGPAATGQRAAGAVKRNIPGSGINRLASARFRDKGRERRGDRECHCVGRSGGTLIIRHPQREDMGHVCIAGVQRLRRETRLERSRVARCHGTVAGPAGPGPEIGHGPAATGQRAAGAVKRNIPGSGINRLASARFRDKGRERRGDRECHCVGRSGGTLIIRHPQREDMGHVCIAGVQRLRRETRLERSRVARCHGTVAGPAGPGPEIGHGPAATGQRAAGAVKRNIPGSGINRLASARFRDKGRERRGDRECHCVGRSGGTLIIRDPYLHVEGDG